MMRSQKKAETTTLKQKKNNYEDEVNEDHNEFPGLRLCVGVLGCHYCAGHIRYRAGGSRRTNLQRAHAKGLVSVDLRRVPKLRWELRTESHYARPPVQRRWHDVQHVRHREHWGLYYYRRHRRGRNLYGEPGLHGHAVNHQRSNFQYICRAGCTEGLDSRDFSQSCRPRSERRNGDTAARAVKGPRLSWQNSTAGWL